MAAPYRAHLVSRRISHPKERFRPGQKILSAVRSIDREKRRITMTHKEPWAPGWRMPAGFIPARQSGRVRSVKEYGSFIELAPNLRPGRRPGGPAPGDGVSVYIKSIRPERMKIKLR